MILSEKLLAELMVVLMRPKFRRYRTEAEVASYIGMLRFGSIAPDPPTYRVVPGDENDDYLMVLAKAVGADCVISGDRHLTQLKAADPPVLTPRAFYQLLVEKGLVPPRPT